MDYPYIKKHLGGERLKKELEFIEKGDWLNTDRKKEEVWLGNYVLKLIDELLRKNEIIPNFKKWVKEAKESKNLKDCLFELICIDNLSKESELIIKQKNDNKVPDGFIVNEKIYIEMTNLEDIPKSIELKVNDLCEKSQDKFKSSLGIHLVGINGFFKYNKKMNKLIPKKELQILIKDLTKKIQKLDKNILCFLLVHNHVAYHPLIREFRLYKEIPYTIFNGKIDWNLLKRILGDFKLINIIKNEQFFNLLS